jgi:hypothetical protein
MEVPLLLEPPAYGATIGPARRANGARLVAVCAALGSLLAVCCAVLVSGGKMSTKAQGLPGFELSLNSAMEVFIHNTIQRERAEAAAQQAEVQRLAAVPAVSVATQRLAAATRKQGSKPEYGKTSSLGMIGTVNFRKVPSDSGPGQAVTASDDGSMYAPSSSWWPTSIFGSGQKAASDPGEGVVSFHIHTYDSGGQISEHYAGPYMHPVEEKHQKTLTFHKFADDSVSSPFFSTAEKKTPEKDLGITEHYSGSYLNVDKATKTFSPGVVSGATASKVWQPNAFEESKANSPAHFLAHTQGLASAPTDTHGLDNKPWRVPASDFPAHKTVQQDLEAKPKAFDVSSTRRHARSARNARAFCTQCSRVLHASAALFTTKPHLHALQCAMLFDAHVPPGAGAGGTEVRAVVLGNSSRAPRARGHGTCRREVRPACQHQR